MTPTQRLMNQLGGICESASTFENALLTLQAYPPKAADIAVLSEDERLAMAYRIDAARRKLAAVDSGLGVFREKLAGPAVAETTGDESNADTPDANGEGDDAGGENADGDNGADNPSENGEGETQKPTDPAKKTKKGKGKKGK